jgi:hypothetical protein
MKALKPISDSKFGVVLEMTESVKKYFEKNK